ncbi:MAG: hypothetical protein GY710_22810 [Desulfobacteraceae bacterium]|nr:hypothetical protein [Desulfobacteraceae bacterium]
MTNSLYFCMGGICPVKFSRITATNQPAIVTGFQYELLETIGQLIEILFFFQKYNDNYLVISWGKWWIDYPYQGIKTIGPDRSRLILSLTTH